MERNLASSLLLCVLARTAASQGGSPDCLLGNDAPVCDHMKLLVRKPLAPSSATCLWVTFGTLMRFLDSLFTPFSWNSGWNSTGRAGMIASHHLHHWLCVILLKGGVHNVSPAVAKIIKCSVMQWKDGSGYCCAEEALPFTQPNGPGLPEQLKLPVGTGRQHGSKEKTCNDYHCSIF